MASSKESTKDSPKEWSAEDERNFQKMLERRKSQMPVYPTAIPKTCEVLAMTDASKRKADDFGFELEPSWGDELHHFETGVMHEQTVIHELLPAGITSLEQWGRTQFAFGKFLTKKVNYKSIYDGDEGYTSWSRSHLTESSSKGPALDWARYVRAMDMARNKLLGGPMYAGTSVRREFTG